MRHFFRKENGQAMVELAITLPILLLLLCGILDFGWVYSNKLILANSSREGARAAVVTEAGDIVQVVGDKVRASVPSSMRDGLTVDVSLLSGDANVTVQSTISTLTPVGDVFFGGQTVTLRASTTMLMG